MRSDIIVDFWIDREGTWYYRGMEISRRDIVTLFYRHLRMDPSGRYFIELGRQRCRVEAEDTAYVVRAVYRDKGEAEDRINLLLSDDSVEELNPETLRIGNNNVPYCRVKNGDFDARFLTSSYYQLAEHIGHDAGLNEYFLCLNGRRHCIPGVKND
jgi:uncharacterized protein